MELDKDYIRGVVAKLKEPLLLSDIQERDTRDQEVTALMAYIAEPIAQSHKEANIIAKTLIEAGKTAAHARIALEASESYEQYQWLSRLSDDLVEHCRGLRSHSKREYTERTLNQ